MRGAIKTSLWHPSDVQNENGKNMIKDIDLGGGDQKKLLKYDRFFGDLLPKVLQAIQDQSPSLVVAEQLKAQSHNKSQ